MSEPQNEKQHELDAETENELKKIKLSLEHGMDLSKSFTSPDLSPETEGQFLDYIQQWEEQAAQRKMVTVFDMAGRPALRPIAVVSDEEISTTLAAAIELLNEHSIRIDTLCEVNDRDLYRFIVEDLLRVEIADIRINGMMHCFTYEDFYPNYPYDIRNRCTEFIRHITDRSKDMTIIPWGLADQITYKGQLYPKDELNSHIIRFLQLFSSIGLNEHKYLSVTLNEAENEAIAVVFVNYSGIINGQLMEFKGNCNYYLKCEYGWWTIHQFETPWEMIV